MLTCKKMVIINVDIYSSRNQSLSKSMFISGFCKLTPVFDIIDCLWQYATYLCNVQHNYVAS